jgi:hypothetical protein
MRILHSEMDSQQELNPLWCPLIQHCRSLKRAALNHHHKEALRSPDIPTFDFRMYHLLHGLYDYLTRKEEFK